MNAASPATAVRILGAMPHGHPMLLVDDVADGPDADSAVAFKNITLNEPCYRHVDRRSRPDDLAYPLSLLVESFGQGAGLLLARKGLLDRAGSSCAMVFGEFRDIEILGAAYPGEQLRHEVRLLQSNSTLAVLGGRTLVRDRVIAVHGELKAFLVPTAHLAGGGAA